MTRKEFLVMGGTAILSLFGVQNFINFFLHAHQAAPPRLEQPKASAKHGFGASKFGV